MTIAVKDASSYFRGLLLLIRKDHRIADSEVDLMKRVGKSLGFEPRFCENAIQEIPESTYIQDAPPLFSSKELARKFVRDGLTLALSDNEFHPAEEEWLRSIVEQNGLDPAWFLREREIILTEKPHRNSLEVETLTVE
jgi:hypothetical protein